MSGLHHPPAGRQCKGCTTLSEYPLVWTWKAGGLRTLDRAGDRCRILARGRMNSVLIEFKDGERAVVSGNGLRRAEAWREVAKRGGTDTRTDTKFSGERKAKPCKRGELGRGN